MRCTTSQAPRVLESQNATDSLYAIKRLVFEEKKLTLEEFKDALDNNFGKGLSKERVEYLTVQILEQMAAAGQEITRELAASVAQTVKNTPLSPEKRTKYDQLLAWIDELPKYGNDIREVDLCQGCSLYIHKTHGTL